MEVGFNLRGAGMGQPASEAEPGFNLGAPAFGQDVAIGDGLRGAIRTFLRHLGSGAVTPEMRARSADEILAPFSPIFGEMSDRYGLPPGLIEHQLKAEMLVKKDGYSPADNIYAQGVRMTMGSFLTGLDQLAVSMGLPPPSNAIKGPNGFSATAGNVKAIPNLTPGIIASISSDPLRVALWNAYDRNAKNGYPHVLPSDLTQAVQADTGWQTVRNTTEVMSAIFAAYTPMVEAYARLPLEERRAIFPDKPHMHGSAAGLSEAQKIALYSFLYLHGPQNLETRSLQAEINERLPASERIRVDGYSGPATERARDLADNAGPVGPSIRVPAQAKHPAR